MLASQGADAHFAQRVHIVQYAEGIICAWVMLAVKLQDASLSKEMHMFAPPR